MKELPSNCFTIIGDLIIENGDEEHVSKLLETFYLYGTLQIRNTKLPDLGFLYSIMMIVSLNENVPVIQIIGNKNLTNPVFGIMASIITRGSKRDAIIQHNHPDIFNKTNGTCEIFGYAPDDMKYRRRLNFIGGDCDANCVFNHSEVTSKTIKFFPNCSLVYGILVFNNNTDVSYAQLEKTFKNMDRLAGGIRVENSKLTSLSFLPYTYFWFYCKNYGLYVINNPLLTNFWAFTEIRIMPGTDYKECNFKIENNKKLNMASVCKEGYLADLLEMETNGNLEDCGCNGNKTMSSLSLYESCDSIYNGLSLINMSATPQDLSSFSNIQVIKGSLNIQNTNIQNLTFLEHFQHLRANTKDGVILNLQNNPNMTRLAFSNLTSIKNANLDGYQNFNLENLHPDFCVTMDEFHFLALFDVSFVNLHAKLCADGIEEKEAQCIFKSMKELPDVCYIIFGDLKIGSGDEEYIAKLQYLVYLFGSLEIRNTKLENLSFMEIFRMIVSLNETQPVLQIIGNKDLTNSTFGNMTNIYTRGKREAIIQDNHPDILMSENGTCNVFGVNPDPRIMYRRRLNYTGGDCADLSEDLERVLSSYEYGESWKKELDYIIPKFLFTDPKCVFNYTEVNSKTIKNFPKCTHVYGIININEKSDVSFKQLENAFKNVTNLFGGVIVQNSNLTSLSFLRQYSYFDCSTYGFHILNNSQLTDGSILPTIYYTTNENLDNTPKIIIKNNANLNLESLCWERSIGDLAFFKTEGNLKNCGCDGEYYSPSNRSQFESCQNVYNGLKLHNVSSSQVTNSLANLYMVRAFLDIQNTDFQNLSFLEHIKRIQANTNDTVILNLKNNPNMTRLGLPNLEEVDIENKDVNGIQYFNFENLHPNFCITLTEFKCFLIKSIDIVKLHSKLCEVTEEEKNPLIPVCYFVSMEELANNCVYIIGDLKINSGDEDHATKLLKVGYLFGSLEIRNTNLTDLSFFVKLRYIIHMDDSRPIIQIIGNKNLKDATLYAISRIYVRDKREAIIQDNHPAIFKNRNGTCDVFAIIPNIWMMYTRRLNYIGGDCGARVEISNSSASWLIPVVFYVAVYWLLKFHL
ncbi:hypothetical protein CAEBREN_29469 [Caenorhabditis brenneri]|uniref:Receptor L-domain domain-containing protein n=1 Tax=Caenorhabditis brenneri TaxID=135651 RepID=G0PN29_CAEBE|nr:hypothetical protein CAEBREN_29469 [Caenorhabditis brenneri]